MVLYVLGIAGNNFTYKQKIIDEPNLRVKKYFLLCFSYNIPFLKATKIEEIQLYVEIFLANLGSVKVSVTNVT